MTKLKNLLSEDSFKKKKRLRPEGETPSGYKYVGGILYPRVTAITKVIDKPWLVEYYLEHGKLQARKLADQAADIGSELHERISAWAGTGIYIGESLTQPFLNWYAKEDITSLVANEKLFISKEHDYCGTPDLVANTKNGVVLYDWKTSGDIYYDYALQLSAYHMMLKENGINSYYAKIVRIPEKTKEIDKFVQVVTIPSVILEKVLFPVFLACKTIFDWQKNFTFKKVKYQ